MTRPVILHIIDSLEYSGGAEQQLVENLRRFSHDSAEHHLAVLKQLPSSRVSDVPSAVAIHELGSGFQGLLRLISLNRRIQPSLIYSSLARASRLARLGGWICRVPVVEALVNIGYESVRIEDHPSVSPAKLRLHRFIERLSTRVPRAFHALSDEASRSWIETVGIQAGRVSVIPRGVAMPQLTSSEARTNARKVIGFMDGEVVVLSVGRQEPQKGQIYLVRALAAVSPDLRIRLVLIGRSGAASGEIHRLKKETTSHAIVDLGEVTDVSPYYAIADIFAFPSLYEGLGVAMLEAMSHGLAVVANDRPPMNWVLDHERTGILVDSSDPRALGESLTRLARDEGLRRELGSRARKEISHRFNIADTSRRLELLLLSLAEDSLPIDHGTSS